MRGRKPKPIELHKRHGTVNVTDHRAQLQSEPIPATKIDETEIPEFLTDAQKDIWRDTLSEAPAGMLKSVDAGFLAVWCEAFDRWRQAVLSPSDVNDFEAFAKRSRAINQAAMLVLKVGAELGLSPASRPRLAIATGMVMDSPALGAPAPRSNTLEAYLARRPADLDS